MGRVGWDSPGSLRHSCPCFIHSLSSGNCHHVLSAPFPPLLLPPSCPSSLPSFPKPEVPPHISPPHLLSALPDRITQTLPSAFTRPLSPPTHILESPSFLLTGAVGVWADGKLRELWGAISKTGNSHTTVVQIHQWQLGAAIWPLSQAQSRSF